MKETIEKAFKKAIQNLGLPEVSFTVEYPADTAHGDLAVNAAMVLSKQAKMNPRELATKIVAEISKSLPPEVEKIDIAGPGFINITLSRKVFSDAVALSIKEGVTYGIGDSQKNSKVLIEYTDPNPFKEFHIGHLMSNAIGESLSRLIASQGAHVERACYQGDVGPHVAKAIYGKKFLNAHFEKNDSLEFNDGNKVTYATKANLEANPARVWGLAYHIGASRYEEEGVKKEIDLINKEVYEKSNPAINALYDEGRKTSLEHFEEIYKKLGTKFDHYFFESEVKDDGVHIVKEFLEKGVFTKSDNAIVFEAQKYDKKLHTRVFINSQGLPTYETKELGLNTLKFNTIHPNRSIIITANEQSEYFKVVLKALEIIAPEVRKMTEHISHGMLRFTEGKMSSRKGNVITGESLILDVEKLVNEKMSDREMTQAEKGDAASAVAIAAIKYSILKQVTSSDIIYDFEKSISFEGDSGPYLLYTAVRAQSILEKAKKEGVEGSTNNPEANVASVERLVAQYPEVVARAAGDLAPHQIATYLIELSSAFNSWYGNTKIVDAEDVSSPWRVVVTASVRTVLENGLALLGMRVPKKM